MLNARRLGDDAQPRAGSERIADGQVGVRLERPRSIRIQRRDLFASADERAASLRQKRQRTLNAVVDAADQPGTERQAQRGAGAEDGRAGTDAGGVFIDLDRDDVLADSDYFADEAQV